MVSSFEFYQLLVGSLLLDRAVLHEDDVIGLLHDPELVGHHQNRPPAGQNLSQHLRNDAAGSSKSREALGSIWDYCGIISLVQTCN